MEKQKKYKLIISVISLIIVLGFMGFYLFSSDIISVNFTAEEETENPDNLFEGSVSELTEDYIVLNVFTPDEISGDLVQIDMDENTKYEELKLEVYSMDDIRRAGAEDINFNQIKNGDEVLVAVSKDILDNIENDSGFTAKVVIKISSKEVK